MFDTTFVEIDLVVDKILEVSQTGEFMSAKMVMKQRWVDNRLVWFSNFCGTKSMATVMLVTKMVCPNFELLSRLYVANIYANLRSSKID